MSQAGIIAVAGGGGGGAPIQTIGTQDGTAVPVGNEIVISAYDSDENNINGIVTKGGVADGDPPGTGALNSVGIYLTNRLQGQITTTDNTGDILLVLDTPTSDNNTYTFDISVSAIAIVDGVTEGAAFKVFGGVVTDATAGTGTVIGVDVNANFKTLGLVGIDVQIVDPGEQTILLVTGLPVDPVEWFAVGYYTQIGS